MGVELHIQLKPGVFGEPDDIVGDFPYEEGQSIVSFAAGVIIIDLAEADDTNYVQDWYLNSNEDVTSYYIVED